MSPIFLSGPLVAPYTIYTQINLLFEDISIHFKPEYQDDFTADAIGEYQIRKNAFFH